MLLPRLVDENDLALQQATLGVYAVIDSQWRDLQPNMEWVPLQVLREHA